MSAPSALLVATSDTGTRALLRKALHVRAVDVVEAADGLEALALARRLELDLVLLDAFLAVVDGISVCARIRAIEGISQPIIAIMGLSSDRTVELAYSEGADEILPKPLQPALIRQRVELLLRRKQNENRLELMERAVESAGTGITILDARSSEYPVTYANPAFLAMAGYKREEILGKNLRLLRGPETDVAAQTELRDAFSSGRPTRVLLKNYRQDTSTFWNDLAATPLHDPSGRVTHYVAVQTDVTQRMKSGKLTAADLEQFAAERTRELEASLRSVEDRRRFTETILNGLIAGLLTTDAQGIVSFANRAALRTLGISLSDCVGRSVVELFGNHEELREAIRRGSDRTEIRLDFPVISPGGARLYVGMSIMGVPDELKNELGFVLLFRDLAETLERDAADKVSRESAAAEAEAAAMLEARRASSEVLARAPGSNGPLATIADRGEASPSDDLGPESPAARRRPHLALRYCAPGELVQQAMHTLAPDLPAGVPLEAPVGLPEVLVDRDQVVEALSRLLGNAAHRAGGASKLRVRLVEAKAMGERGVRPEPFIRVDILFPPEEITEDDLGTDPGGTRRRAHRREDLATAEQLLQANGGRLVPPPTETPERCLSALIPAGSRAVTPSV
jgi:PAS domain S-box-containing protein